jgi:hypothetical protein
MQRELSARLPDRAAADQVIEDSSEMQPIVGRVVARGLADELQDRHYLIVDGIDGRSHYIDLGKGEAVESLPEDAVIRVVGSRRGVREVDRTIVEVAAAMTATTPSMPTSASTPMQAKRSPKHMPGVWRRCGGLCAVSSGSRTDAG